MTLREEDQLEEILELDRRMMSVDFTRSVVVALLVDLTQYMSREEMKRELNEIMERVYGGEE